jgi:hypothetical protein
MQIKNKKHMTMALIAIVPAVLFGGFFMAESFTNSDIQMADAILEVPFTMDENNNNHFTIELTESLSISDSVEVGSP